MLVQKVNVTHVKTAFDLVCNNIRGQTFARILDRLVLPGAAVVVFAVVVFAVVVFAAVSSGLFAVKNKLTWVILYDSSK